MDIYLTKLRSLGYEVVVEKSHDKEIQCRIIIPNRSQTEREMEEIFSVILDSFYCNKDEVKEAWAITD